MTNSNPYGIVIHGGAGTILRANLTEVQKRAYRAALTESLETGFAVLRDGGSALDAAQRAVNVMEDSPLFNAGKGAVFTHEGTNEQDACLMDGRTLAVGAVAGVKRIRNPINLARLVMDKSPHVLLGGEGAERFASQNGMELVDAEYFFTEHRWEQLMKALAKEEKVHAVLFGDANLDHSSETKFGTVGAVVLDREGNLAAATSTGGMTNKRFGRIGDTPIIGAGTYANNASCAVSATGHGEYVMRTVLAHDIHALMIYKEASLAEAAELAIRVRLTELGGVGGLVAIDRLGNVAMPFNSEGMYRGMYMAGGEPTTAIFRE